MATTIDMNELLKKNPRVSAEKLAASMKMLDQLRELGVTSCGFRLRIPYTGHRASIDESARIDAMTARLPR